MPSSPLPYESGVPQEDYEDNEEVDEDYDNAQLGIKMIDKQGMVPSLSRKNALKNFILMSILFSANHGCVTSALALAVSRLGTTGSLSSGVLYFSYTASSILGATHITKILGARGALTLGMGLYCVYVGCFSIATAKPELEVVSCVIGAIVGGIGGGFIWTAQGSYFSDSSKLFTNDSESIASSSSFLGGLFAFIYLALEISLKPLSTELIRRGSTWGLVYGIYSFIAIVSTIGTLFLKDLKASDSKSIRIGTDGNENESTDKGKSILCKTPAAIRLLMKDPKMKYMIGLNASFGFASSFINSYVSGTVEMDALNDKNSEYIGVLSATTACVAALFSLIFGFVGTNNSSPNKKGFILSIGSIFFFLVAFPFTIRRDTKAWGWAGLLAIYSFQGVGRSTFEGTLRSVFADMFPQDKEGAFANIVLQNGLSSTIGFLISARSSSPIYLLLCVMLSSVIGVIGYWRAATIFKVEQRTIASPLI